MVTAPTTATTPTPDTTYNDNDDYNASFEDYDGRSGTATNDIVTVERAKEIAYGVLKEEVGRDLTQLEKDEVDRLINAQDTQIDKNGDGDFLDSGESTITKANLKSVFEKIEGATDLDIFTDVTENTAYNNLTLYSDLKKLGTDASNPARIIDNPEDIGSTSAETQAFFNQTSDKLLLEVNVDGDYTKADTDKAIIDGFGAYQKTQTPPDYSENALKDYLELLSTNDQTAKASFNTALAAIDEPTDLSAGSSTTQNSGTVATPDDAKDNLEKLQANAQTYTYDQLIGIGLTDAEIAGAETIGDIEALVAEKAKENLTTLGYTNPSSVYTTFQGVGLTDLEIAGFKNKADANEAYFTKLQENNS